MTKNEWYTIAKHMKLYYKRSKDFLATEEDVIAWYGFFMDMDFDLTKKAIGKIIGISPYPPSIADIKLQYEELAHKNQMNVREIKEIYKEMVNYYPVCLRDKDSAKAFQMAFNSLDDKNPIDRARKIKKAVIQAVKDVERGNTDNLPILSECIRKCIDEYRKNEQ